MYFATYQLNGAGAYHIGLADVEARKLIPLEYLYQALGQPNKYLNIPRDMQEFIENSNSILIRKLSNISKEERLQSKAILLEDVKLCAPIPYPRRNIFCVGKNYLDHVHELSDDFGDKPEAPVFFSKIAYPAIGDGDLIDPHIGITKELDYEVELAVIIGKEGKNIPKEKAEEYIFGYTILNDVTARDLQRKHSQWDKGKSLDTFCPMGPFLVYKDEFSLNVNIRSSINGELRQDSNTKHLIFDISTLIHILSQGLTLKPGDILATGTPSGVGMGFKPPRYLKSGDKVTCSIEKIGTLTNIVK